MHYQAQVIKQIENLKPKIKEKHKKIMLTKDTNNYVIIKESHIEFDDLLLMVDNIANSLENLEKPKININSRRQESLTLIDGVKLTL